MKGTQGFDGFVEFAFEIDHPSFEKVDVKSQLKRLKPETEAEEISPELLSKLTSILFNWVKETIDIENHPNGVKYFEAFTDTNTRAVILINPFSKVDGESMLLFNKFTFWVWYCDDEVEAAIENGISPENLNQAIEQFCGILKGNYDNGEMKYQEVDGYPQFRMVFDLLLDVHNIFKKKLPNYQERVGPVRFFIRQYLQAMRWFCVERIDARYSETAFQLWRTHLGLFDALVEVVALVEGVNVPLKIRKSPTVMRLLEICNEFSSFTNDLLGMKKEFQSGEKDNMVVFKTLEKKIPLAQAVKEICDHLDDKLGDFLLIKRVVLIEFNNEPNLVRYLGIMESMIDGHNKFYATSERHLCAGEVKLYRETLQPSGAQGLEFC